MHYYILTKNYQIKRFKYINEKSPKESVIFLFAFGLDRFDSWMVEPS